MRTLLPILALSAGPGLFAQIADEAFLKGNPIQVMLACSHRTQALEPNNSRLLAEHARALQRLTRFLASPSFEAWVD